MTETITANQDTATPDREYGELTDRQRRFIAMAAEHADDFRTRAAEHDREGTFPFENHQKMHESGYAHISVPSQFGGQDATLEDLCLAQERLAQGCASTALGANMHLFFLGMLAEQWRATPEPPPMMAMPFQMVTNMKMTMGAALSERDSSDPFGYPSGTVERVEGGYKLNGAKVFGSNSAVSPSFFFSGVLVEDDGTRKVLLFQVPKGTPGANLIEDWDTLGMRATASYTTEYKDCVVPEQFVTGAAVQGEADPQAEAFVGGFLCWFEPSVGAVYTGIAVEARNLAREAAMKRTRLPHGEVKHYPSVQYGIAEMYIGIETARAMIRRTAQRLSDPGWRDGEAVALAIASKLVAVDNARRVVDMAMEITGGGAFSKRNPLERLYRDVRAGGFHPPHGYDALEVIGKSQLGIDRNHSPRFQ